MLLTATTVPNVDGDLSQIQQKALFSSTLSKEILLLVIVLLVVAVYLVYSTISKQRNKYAGESIFLANKGKAKFNRILLLYNTLDNLPPTKKYLNRLRREFEMVAPGDERFAKERATWITLFTWGGGALATILVLLLKPTLYMFFIVMFTVYIVSQEAVNTIVEKNEMTLMTQFLQFLSRFRYHYLIDNTVDDAIMDSIAEVPHLMQLHAKLILSVLQSDSQKIDEELLRYKNAISNLYLKQFLAICVTTMQNGDQKVDGQSLCLTNVKDLRVDVEIEIRKRKDIKAGFGGAVIMVAVPVYTLQAISNWGVSTISSLQSFYYGTMGSVMMMGAFVVTIATYAKINQMRETHHQQASEHYVLRAVCEWKLVKKFTTNYWNVNYGKKLRLEKLLKRTGSNLHAEHFLIQSILCGFTAFFASLVILLASNVSTRDYINTDYSSIASEATSGTEEQLIIVMMLTKYYYDFYRDQDILELYKQATGQNVDKYTEDVQTWFNSQLEQHFSEGGAQLSEEDTIALIQQYNQINSASTMMYTKLFGTTGVPVYDENDIESKKAFNQMKKLIESAAEKEPLYNTTGLYELVEKYTYNKYIAYHNTYFHWWFYLIAVIALVVVYNVPMLLMRSKEEELQVIMQDEVIQYHAIILLLIYFENVNALTILEWMNIFSEVFTTSIARCITDFTMNEQDALQKLYDSEPYEPFQRIVENLMMVDDVGVLQAFNELSATRKSNQESRSQDNKNIIAKRAEKAGMLMQAPLWYVALGYLVGPMIIEAFKQMANMVSEISTM